jgi:UPF0271 protein
MKTIDLSCDLGEAESHDDRLREDELWPLITSANVACGGHAGDRDSMEMAVRHCSERGIRLGAHPSYPDRLHFGRDPMDITTEALKLSLIEQIAELRDMGADENVELTHIKPHGALYNEAHHNRTLAETIVEAVRAIGQKVAVVCSPGSQLLEAARAAGSPIIAEGFADRRYAADGSLVSRRESNALLLDYEEAAAQALGLAQSGRFATLCVHGDMENAAERLRRIRHHLQKNGYTISSASC